MKTRDDRECTTCPILTRVLGLIRDSGIVVKAWSGFPGSGPRFADFDVRADVAGAKRFLKHAEAVGLSPEAA